MICSLNKRLPTPSISTSAGRKPAIPTTMATRPTGRLCSPPASWVRSVVCLTPSARERTKVRMGVKNRDQENPQTRESLLDRLISRPVERCYLRHLDLNGLTDTERIAEGSQRGNGGLTQ